MSYPNVIPCIANVKRQWHFTNDGILVSVSYEERLSGLVLKEEFFPLVDELKVFIGTLTAAGKGTVCFPGF